MIAIYTDSLYDRSGNPYPKSTGSVIEHINELLILIDPDNLPTVPRLDIFDMAERIEYTVEFEDNLTFRLWQEQKTEEDGQEEWEKGL